MERCPYCEGIMGDGMGFNSPCYISYISWVHPTHAGGPWSPHHTVKETLFCTTRNTSFQRIVGIGGFRYGWVGANWKTFEPAEIVDHEWK